MNIPKSPKLEYTLSTQPCFQCPIHLTNRIQPLCAQALVPSPRKQHEPFSSSPLWVSRTSTQLPYTQYQIISTHLPMAALILHLMLLSVYYYPRPNCTELNTPLQRSVNTSTRQSRPTFQHSMCHAPLHLNQLSLYPGLSRAPGAHALDPHHFRSSNFCLPSPFTRRTFS